MAKQETGPIVSGTTGSFKGTVNGVEICPTAFLIGIDNSMLTIFIDEFSEDGKAAHLLSLHLPASREGKFEILFSSREARFFYENHSGLLRPIEDNTLYFDFDHTEQTYKGHFNNFIFGPFLDGQIGKTYNITATFDLTGRVNPATYKEKLDRFMNAASALDQRLGSA